MSVFHLLLTIPGPFRPYLRPSARGRRARRSWSGRARVPPCRLVTWATGSSAASMREWTRRLRRWARRPLEGAPGSRLRRTRAGCRTAPHVQLAVGQFDRPVAGRALRAGEPGGEPRRAVGGQVAEAQASPRAPSRAVPRRRAARTSPDRRSAFPCCRIYPGTVSLCRSVRLRRRPGQHRGERLSQVAEFLVAVARRRRREPCADVPANRLPRQVNGSRCAATAPALPCLRNPSHRPGSQSAIHCGRSRPP